jgi:hypothetical protein
MPTYDVTVGRGVEPQTTICCPDEDHDDRIEVEATMALAWDTVTCRAHHTAFSRPQRRNTHVQ